jgi:hypothetical protein
MSPASMRDGDVVCNTVPPIAARKTNSGHICLGPDCETISTTCDVLTGLDYPGAPNLLSIGAVVRAHVSVGSGELTGGGPAVDPPAEIRTSTASQPIWGQLSRRWTADLVSGRIDVDVRRGLDGLPWNRRHLAQSDRLYTGQPRARSGAHSGVLRPGLRCPGRVPGKPSTPDYLEQVVGVAAWATPSAGRGSPSRAATPTSVSSALSHCNDGNPCNGLEYCNGDTGLLDRSAPRLRRPERLHRRLVRSGHRLQVQTERDL